jgi:hypothetical protein
MASIRTSGGSADSGWTTVDWNSATVVSTGAYDATASTINGQAVSLVTKASTHGAPDAGLDAGGLWVPINLPNTSFGMAFEITFGGAFTGGLTTSDIGFVLCLADTNSETADKGIYAGMTARTSSGGSYRPVAGYLGYTQGNGSMVAMTPGEMHGAFLLANGEGVVASSTLFNSLGVNKDPHCVHNRTSDALGSSLYLGLLPIVVPSGAAAVTMPISAVKWAAITAP